MSRTNRKEQVTVDKLLEDLQTVVADSEALLKATATHAGEKVQEVRARAQESISAARDRLAEVQQGALKRARELVTSSDEFVHENPWQSVGIAAGAGLLIGLLINFGRR